MATELKRMSQIYGTEADWSANDIVLSQGEIGITIINGVPKMKVGDGVSTFSSLPYCYVPLTGTDSGVPITGPLEFDASGSNGGMIQNYAVEGFGVGTEDALSYTAVGANTGVLYSIKGVGGTPYSYGFRATGEFMIPANQLNGQFWFIGPKTWDAVDDTLVIEQRNIPGVVQQRNVVIRVSDSLSFGFRADPGAGVSGGFLELPRDTIDTDEPFAATSKGYVDALIAALDARVTALEP
jgi:hypothetical protein